MAITIDEELEDKPKPRAGSTGSVVRAQFLPSLKNLEGETARQRVQLDFSQAAFSRLEEIRKLAGSKTNSEVIRNAIRVYEWFLRQQKAGFRIHLASEDIIKEVELLI